MDHDDDGYASNGSTGGDESPNIQQPPQFEWSLAFKQPASDYLAFR